MGTVDPELVVHRPVARCPGDRVLRRVIEATRVSDAFHARYSALLKEYRYQMWDGQVVPPFLARYVWRCRSRLDERAMAESAAKPLESPPSLNAKIR